MPPRKARAVIPRMVPSGVWHQAPRRRRLKAAKMGQHHQVSPQQPSLVAPLEVSVSFFFHFSFVLANYCCTRSHSVIAVIGLIALAFFIVIRRGKQKQQHSLPGSPPPSAMAGDTGTLLHQQAQRYSIYPTGLEVAAFPPKPSPTPPSSTASPQLQMDEHEFSRTSAAVYAAAPASPISPVHQHQRGSVYPPPQPMSSSHIQNHHAGAELSGNAHAHPQQHRQSRHSMFPQDSHASQHIELPAYARSQQMQQQQVLAQHQTVTYGPQTQPTFVYQPVAAEMSVGRGDGELRELGQYR